MALKLPNRWEAHISKGTVIAWDGPWDEPFDGKAVLARDLQGFRGRHTSGVCRVTVGLLELVYRRWINGMHRQLIGMVISQLN